MGELHLRTHTEPTRRTFKNKRSKGIFRYSAETTREVGGWGSEKIGRLKGYPYNQRTIGGYTFSSVVGEDAVFALARCRPVTPVIIKWRIPEGGRG